MLRASTARQRSGVSQRVIYLVRFEPTGELATGITICVEERLYWRA
jgi:hypothetical protein